MGLVHLLFGSREKPIAIIHNVLGEEIDRIAGVHDLQHLDLRGRQWACADLRKFSLAFSDCEGINLLGANLTGVNFFRANLRGADLSFSKVEGARFCKADLIDCSFYEAQTGWPYHTHFGHGADFREAKIDHTTDIRGRWGTS